MTKGTIRENVEAILAKHPGTRNDDKDLMLTYWEEIDNVKLGNRFDFIFFATSPESIRRARQLIQEEGSYLPDDEVVAKRRRRESQMVHAVRRREVI
jgi:hypothetical protein